MHNWRQCRRKWSSCLPCSTYIKDTLLTCHTVDTALHPCKISNVLPITYPPPLQNRLQRRIHDPSRHCIDRFLLQTPAKCQFVCWKGCRYISSLQRSKAGMWISPQLLTRQHGSLKACQLGTCQSKLKYSLYMAQENDERPVNVGITIMSTESDILREIDFVAIIKDFAVAIENGVWPLNVLCWTL